MPFEPGQLIVRRYRRVQRYTWIQPMRVIDGTHTDFRPDPDWPRLRLTPDLRPTTDR